MICMCNFCFLIVASNISQLRKNRALNRKDYLVTTISLVRSVRNRITAYYHVYFLLPIRLVGLTINETNMASE